MTVSPRRKRGGVPTPVLKGALLFILAGGAASYAFVAPPPKLDENMCRKDLPGITQIFIDTTDRLSERQAIAMKKIVKDALHPMVTGAMLEVGTLGTTWDGLWTPSLSVCRPALTSEESDSGATTRHLENTYNKVVAPKLDKILTDLTLAAPATSSPIFEAIGAQVAEGNALHPTGIRRLIILSDFLESVPGFAEPRNAKLSAKSVALPDFANIEADLHGIEVQLYMLDRARARWLQTRGHRAFIKAWFAQRGATVAEPILINN